MRNEKRNIVFALIIIGTILSSCITKRLEEKTPQIPPNVRIYYHSRELVWKNLIQTIRNEYLISFDYASFKRGYFVCQEIKNADQPAMKTKFRLSGSITFDGSGTVVTIYKHSEFWDENDKAWKSEPTDYNLETDILQRLSAKLGDLKKK